MMASSDLRRGKSSSKCERIPREESEREKGIVGGSVGEGREQKWMWIRSKAGARRELGRREGSRKT